MPSRSKGSTSASPAKSSKPNAVKNRAQKKSKVASNSSDEEPDSDALDEDSADENVKTKKRKRPSAAQKTRSPKKRRNVDSDEEDFELDLKEGQEIAGVVVRAPKTGQVPPGQISQNTFDFLTQLKDPKCNDREWFKLHDPVFRQAETEWNDFVAAFTELLVEVDSEIPPLPPKDVTHRIYRDMRFSNDKTPYKTGFSATFSRSGRKGIFAQFKPGGQSLLAAGSWCPGKNELATIRSNIQHDPTRLRDVISAPTFVRYFGDPKPHPQGARRNIFGSEDELKVAPKGIAKTHDEIDLLKCRSFAVSHRFTDAQVLAPDFKNKLADMVHVVMPLVHCLNDMMTVAPDAEESEDEG
ncbi:hypothetical protein C8J57DRAFT_1586403 [Mycena rebaudengoi]|nr:hypothetical protein C8J57DRAFT_1586403 [Mycena rebaudengoi]